MSIESVMPSNHLIPCHPLLLLPSIIPSIKVFPSESALCIRWPKCCSFSFNISPSDEDSGLVSFRMDWLDLPAVQGTLKSLLQHHSSKASVLQCSGFFTVQLFIVQPICYVYQSVITAKTPKQSSLNNQLCTNISHDPQGKETLTVIYRQLKVGQVALFILASFSHVSVALTKVICLFPMCPCILQQDSSGLFLDLFKPIMMAIVEKQELGV